MERRKNDKEILILLTELKKDIDYLKERVDKINGSINNYPIYKERVDMLFNDMDKIKPIVTSMKIKVYGIATTIGIISGGVMGTIGIFIGKILGG